MYFHVYCYFASENYTILIFSDWSILSYTHYWKRYITSEVLFTYMRKTKYFKECDKKRETNIKQASKQTNDGRKVSFKLEKKLKTTVN